MREVMNSRRFFLLSVVVFVLVAEFFILYYFLVMIPGRKTAVKLPEEYLVKIPEDKIPRFILPKNDLKELEKAFHREKEFLQEKIVSGEKISFGKEKLAVSLVKDSAELLLKTIKEAKDEDEFNRLVRERFVVYQAAGKEGKGRIIFTGYYSPVYEGSFKKQGSFKYPIYLKPEDLKVVDLGRFNPVLKGEKIVYRIDPLKKEIVPYWSTKDIVEKKVLEGKGLELLYLKSKIDRFYLMIEGSGKIILNNGEEFWVRYSATNGRPYTSVGKLLVKDGKISRDKLSLESIKKYFQRHPEEMDKYLNQNERFTFFVKNKQGRKAVGATGGELTPYISIAIDKKIFPLGALAYIKYQNPRVNVKGKVKQAGQIARFVFCQDTGGIIKGPEKVDIYFGEGKDASARASIKNTGKLYFFIKK
ncbi:MltA domain-containing protein [Candidatus Aerophobetes bacterium]|nr:MltA domain-containing protein [Candidatus Aerophobetes bacterium]